MSDQQEEEKEQWEDEMNLLIYSNVFGDAHPSLSIQTPQFSLLIRNEIKKILRESQSRLKKEMAEKLEGMKRKVIVKGKDTRELDLNKTELADKKDLIYNQALSDVLKLLER